jgi:hypothetical protein
MEWQGVKSDDKVVRFEVKRTMRRQGGVKGDCCIMRRRTFKVRPTSSMVEMEMEASFIDGGDYSREVFRHFFTQGKMGYFILKTYLLYKCWDLMFSPPHKVIVLTIAFHIFMYCYHYIFSNLFK